MNWNFTKKRLRYIQNNGHQIKLMLYFERNDHLFDCFLCFRARTLCTMIFLCSAPVLLTVWRHWWTQGSLTGRNPGPLEVKHISGPCKVYDTCPEIPLCLYATEPICIDIMCIHSNNLMWRTDDLKSTSTQHGDMPHFIMDIILKHLVCYLSEEFKSS